MTVDLAAGTATDGFGNHDTLANVENVIGSRFGDTIAGNAGNNTINGADGNDFLTGGAGSDTFVFAAPVGTFAGSGDDTITDFAAGSDRIDIAAYHFADFAAVMAQTADVGGAAVLTLDGQDSVTLTGVTKDQLHALDFIL